MGTASSSAPTAAAGVRIRRRRPEDGEALFQMYAEVFGESQTEASRRRWRWQYEENPCCPQEGPEIWVAEEGGEILGQYATMPVRVKVKDRVLRGSWGMDVMVKRGLQRKGVGSRLFLYWDRQVEASLGLGLSPSSYALFKKLQWQDVGPVPCYTRVLDVSRLLARRVGPIAASILDRPLSVLLGLAFPARRSPPAGPPVAVEPLEGDFGPAYDRLWEKASPGFDFAAERGAAYLQWKYRRAPHHAYQVFQAFRGGELTGFLVARVLKRPAVRLGLLVDLFAHPEDHPTLDALIDHAAAWGRENQVGRLQTFTLDRRIGARLRRKGFFEIASPMQFCLKVNAGPLDPSFFADTSRWHVAFGDSDQDRQP